MNGAASGAGGTRPFVHLHTHTEYSLLDGMSRLSDVVGRAAREGMPAVAITDHGNLIGALKFHEAAREVGVKPILGCEAYVAPGSRREQNPDSENQHLVLLAKNRTGFQNLMRLSSIAYTEGFYFKPRMDLELLAEHHDGLIALSACPKGIVPREVITGGDPVEWAGRYQEVFGKDNYYLEIMDHTPPGGATPEGARLSDLEQRIGAGVVEVARKTGIPLVGTNDSHYASAEDADAHDLRLCISTNRPVRDPRRLKFHSDQFFFKTSEEMRAVFDDCPDAYRNTLEIAEQVDDFELLDRRNLLPDFEVPAGTTLDAHFEESARGGLARRLESPEVHGDRPPRQDYEDRLAMELDVIRRTGYSAYFLIVQDFVRFAQDCHIPVGPGRGSAAGSLVAYALGITDIDPLAHGLLFERFLNSERISPPDIDVDFCEVRREEVLDYVTENYGNDRVAQIMTLGTMQARLVVRDVGRMLELPPPQVDRLAKLIPDGMSLPQALESVPELREARRNPDLDRLFELAGRLEGLPRSIGTHAAGVVIAPGPLEEILPLYRDVETRRPGSGRASKGSGQAVTVRRRTQWDMNDCESAGLFKMDFLGLRNLTQIEDCARRVQEDPNTSRTAGEVEALALIRAGHFEKVPPDPETFRLFARADTDGIFQFESPGMRDLLARYEPENLDDLAAMNALYRPGPLESGMADDFVAAKKKGRLSEKLDPRVRELVPETRGLIVYQEQVMLVAQQLAGFSLNRADVLRKAMGKKDPERMAREEGGFVEGAVAGGLSRQVAQETFQQIAKFAGYGFNRSHAVGYALVAYVAGWLKTHFPLHFLASLLTAQHRAGDKDERIARIRHGAESAGIPVLPPDVQRSGAEAVVEGRGVRYGLEAVKQVGSRAAREIERARRESGRFESLRHFLEAVEPKSLNRGVVEALCCAGALDFLDVPRSRILPAIPGALEAAHRIRGRKEAGVQSLFGGGCEPPVDVFPEARSWSDAERLRREREALGFYWQGHPATEYRAALEPIITGPVKAALGAKPKAAATVVGLARELRKRTTRGGRPMGQFTLEDETGAIGVVVFPDLWETCPSLDGEPVVVVQGNLRGDAAGSPGGGGRRGQRGELAASEIRLADEAPYQLAHRVELLVTEPERLGHRLQELFVRHPGTRPLLLRVRNRGIEVLLETATEVHPSRAFARAAWELLGPDTVRLDGELPPSFAQ
ncbi:MAG: DNA polymerase III subunit alpha [Acidobacteriota bacterium]|nr:DNA polymerase III subunit alpha [Acidobacteriota bacterium]